MCNGGEINFLKVLYEAENRGFKIPSAGRSVRSPNVHIMLVCYWAFCKPRAGALGSLTECPLDIRPCGHVISPFVNPCAPSAFVATSLVSPLHRCILIA